MLILNLALVLSIASFAPQTNAYAQNKPNIYDWLIVDSYENLTVYNKYQQRVRMEDLPAAYTPAKILKNRVTLSDRMTIAMQVELEGAHYYLLRNQSGRNCTNGWSH